MTNGGWINTVQVNIRSWSTASFVVHRFFFLDWNVFIVLSVMAAVSRDQSIKLVHSGGNESTTVRIRLVRRWCQMILPHVSLWWTKQRSNTLTCTESSGSTALWWTCPALAHRKQTSWAFHSPCNWPHQWWHSAHRRGSLAKAKKRR